MTDGHHSRGLEAAFGHPRGTGGSSGGLLMTWMGRRSNRWLMKVLDHLVHDPSLPANTSPGLHSAVAQIPVAAAQRDGTFATTAVAAAAGLQGAGTACRSGRRDETRGFQKFLAVWW